MEDFKIKSNYVDTTAQNNDDAHSDTHSIIKDNFGEKTKRDCLIVMGDISGLAGTFLTIARKYRYHCIYIFYTIHPEKGIWKPILSQTNILNIFPASVSLNTVKKILESNCIRNTNKYIPVNSLWVTQLFIPIANTDEKTCLTIDSTGFNPIGPGRYRTGGENPNSQTCFFNKADDNHMFNVFVSKRIKGEEEPYKILFEIEVVKSKTNNETYSAVSELENLT